MYGMEDYSKQKSKPNQPTYELERELKDSKTRKEIVDKCEQRVNTLKAEIRSGAQKEMYDQLGLLLQGYMALKKVINKCIQS